MHAYRGPTCFLKIVIGIIEYKINYTPSVYHIVMPQYFSELHTLADKVFTFISVSHSH